jgi:predicted ester cyclase
VASTSEIARAYYAAQNAHDLDGAVGLWKTGAIDRLVGDRELVAPDGIREYLGGVFDAFPDFALEVIELTTTRGRTAVRWRATGTFAGPGRLQGFAATHAQMAIEGCDVLTIQDDLIVHNDAYSDSGDVARQLGLAPESE